MERWKRKKGEPKGRRLRVEGHWEEEERVSESKGE